MIRIAWIPVLSDAVSATVAAPILAAVGAGLSGIHRTEPPPPPDALVPGVSWTAFWAVLFLAVGGGWSLTVAGFALRLLIKTETSRRRGLIVLSVNLASAVVAAASFLLLSSAP
jgi:hypothetical protein